MQCISLQSRAVYFSALTKKPTVLLQEPVVAAQKQTEAIRYPAPAESCFIHPTAGPSACSLPLHLPSPPSSSSLHPSGVVEPVIGSWQQGLRKYAFPSVSLLAKTLCEDRVDEEQLLLVALYWPNRTWFSEFMLLATAPPWWIYFLRDGAPYATCTRTSGNSMPGPWMGHGGFR